jgi:peptidoglycan/LPS O-acetylase OafA/YrhL
VLQSPIVTLIFNGHFAVMTFFVLSGFVLTLPHFRSQHESIKSRLWGRYLRLNIPIIISIAISLVIYKLGLYHNTAAAIEVNSGNWLGEFMPQGITLSAALKSALFDAIVFGQSPLNPPLWTLKIEFFGSIYLLALYACAPHNKPVFATGIVAILLYLIYGQESIYFIIILAGALLNLFRPSRTVAVFCVVVGLYLGAFQYKSVFYDFLPHIHWDRKNLYNALGALFLTAGVMGGAGRSLLESRLLQFLGKQSFSLYLVHFIVLCSCSSTIYLNLQRTNLNLAINFTIYILISFVAAALMTRFIDKPAINISHWFSKWLFPRNTSATSLAKPIFPTAFHESQSNASDKEA